MTIAAVACDVTVVLARGSGTAMDFALKLIELLCGTATCQCVEPALVRSRAVVGAARNASL